MTEPVYAPIEKLKTLPKSINIGEQEFANLLGVHVQQETNDSDDNETEEEDIGNDKVISLDLDNQGSVANLQINLSEEERLVVALQIDLPKNL